MAVLDLSKERLSLKIVLCVLVSRCVVLVQGAAINITDNSSQRPQDHHQCPKKSTKALLNALGERKRLIQPYSPVPLCRSDLTPKRLTNKGPEDVAQHLSDVYRTMGNQSTCNVSSYPGCSKADIQQLMVEQPRHSDVCQWRIRCCYDPDRFPHIVYQAYEMPGNSQLYCTCNPIVRRTWRLRSVRKGNCKVWSKKPKQEVLLVGYRCSE